MYVYREYAEPLVWGATINIDGNGVSTLSQGGFTWFYVKPGDRKLTAKWPVLSGQSNSEISLNIKKNGKYYVELTGSSRVSGMYGNSIYFKMGSGLNPLGFYSPPLGA